MNGEQAAASASPASERRFEGRLQGWELVFLVALSAVLLLATVWKSSREYYNNDEFCTALLVANPSFSQMWNTIRHGGELNPPLYFAVEWVVARLVGTGELALRCPSAISIVLAGWVLFFTVRPVTGPRLAALTIALIFGLSRDVFYFAWQARYYGMVFLLVAVGLFLALRFTSERPLRRRDYVMVFLTHVALVYVHVYGVLFSGALFAAMLARDWLRGKLRWKLYLPVLAAWAAFGAWLPILAAQAGSKGGYTPSNYHAPGWFFNTLELQVPLGLVLLLVALLGGLALLATRPCPATEEARACWAPESWAAIALAALSLMMVPLVTWLASFKITAFFMERYVFPCTAAWVLILALVSLALYRLPPTQPVFRRGVPPQVWSVAWFGVLAFCLLFQPLRSRKDPLLPATPFTDDDYGYKNLPMVFEDSWYYLPRAFYGKNRQYLLLTDHDAAEADPGWYTKNMDRFFRAWYPAYGKTRIVHCEDLPEEFLAVDDDIAKTFEWLFAHRPELKSRLLGTCWLDPEHGDQRVYLVQRVPPNK
jgi:hypothetical protein